jgi:hypothetical protein
VVPRNPRLADDRSELDGARIELGPRIGWLLRVSRTSRDVPLRSMARELGETGLPTSASALSRIEAEGLRHGAVIDGYEQVLRLVPGSLRAAIDLLCRTFDHAPPDQQPDACPATLTGFSAAVDAVLEQAPSGGDWLRFAREHAGDRGFGLPSAQMQPLVARLASEMARSVGVAYTSRYEALARLRCGPYGDVVEEVVRAAVLAPDTGALVDLMVVLSERPTPQLLTWAGELLASERRTVMLGATLVLHNMRSVGGLATADWLALAPWFLAAYADAGLPRRLILTRLFKTLPPHTRTAIKAGLTDPLEHVPGPSDWTRTRRNRHYECSTELAARACADAGLPEQPLLSRLLFEVLYDFRATRAATASYLVLASPVAEALHPLLVEAAVSGADRATREGARGALTLVQTGLRVPDVASWLDGADDDLFEVGTVLLGQAGVQLPDAALEAGLAGDDRRVRRVLYAAGMARDPRLTSLRTDPARPAAVRDAAAWWVREGGRVTV